MQTNNLVGGQWLGGTADTLDITDPATGATIAQVPNFGADVAATAITAAAKALPAWRSQTAQQRGGILRRLADLMLANRDRLAALMVREQARDYTFKFGEALKKRGYRGYFEVDYLIDLDSDQLYLGEVNPRVTGASSMTNLAAFAHADAPLFLFHLLEYGDVDFELDVAALNDRWADPDNIDDWGQLVIKFTKDEIQHVTKAPASGVYEIQPDGTLQYVRMQTHRRTAQSANRAFFLRIVGEGDYFYEGADLGILVSRGRLMTEDFELNERGRAWTKGIRALYEGVPLVKAREQEIAAKVADIGGFKML
tara:strand:- start:92 stop:1021 length:930 start_codon:yes stop_codon:yes gene_type:complete